MLYKLERHAVTAFEKCRVVRSVGYRDCAKAWASDANLSGKLKEPVINGNLELFIGLIEIVAIIEVMRVVAGEVFLQASCYKAAVNKRCVDADIEIFEGGLV